MLVILTPKIKRDWLNPSNTLKSVAHYLVLYNQAQMILKKKPQSRHAKAPFLIKPPIGLF
jgi:hypothetical protein